jgi:hypothetical protein
LIGASFDPRFWAGQSRPTPVSIQSDRRRHQPSLALREQSYAPGSVHKKPCFDLLFLVSSQTSHGQKPLFWRTPGWRQRAGRLNRPDPSRDRSPQQDMVESAAVHLEPAFAARLKSRPGLARPTNHRPVRSKEPCAFHFFANAQLIQQRYNAWWQRFADVRPGKGLSFDHNDVVTERSQSAGKGRACGAAAYYANVCAQVQSDLVCGR